MYVSITSIPARSIVRTIPAHTDIEIAYEFEDLSSEAQERAVNDMRCERLELDMDSEREFYGCNDFPNSVFNMEWSAGYCQGDGVNVYGKFSMNDLLAYAGLGSVENDFWVDIKPNRMPGCTYCTWYTNSQIADIFGQVESEYGYWECDLTENGVPEEFADKLVAIFTDVWEKRIEKICEAMTRLCGEIQDYMDSLAIGDGYFDPSWHDDILYDEDGIWLCNWWDWNHDGASHMTLEEYQEAFK